MASNLQGVQLQPALDSGQLVVQAPLLGSAVQPPFAESDQQAAVRTPLRELVQRLSAALQAQANRQHAADDNPGSQQEAIILVIDSLSVSRIRYPDIA
jgi:hypothetical protein